MANKVLFDTSIIKGKMRELGITQKELSVKLGIGYTSMNFKLVGRKEFKISEVCLICQILDIYPIQLFKVIHTEEKI